MYVCSRTARARELHPQCGGLIDDVTELLSVTAIHSSGRGNATPRSLARSPASINPLPLSLPQRVQPLSCGEPTGHPRATVSPKFQEVSAEIDVQLGRNGSSRSLPLCLMLSRTYILILGDLIRIKRHLLQFYWSLCFLLQCLDQLVPLRPIQY